MSRLAKFGFPLVLCLVTVTLLTCGKDSPDRAIPAQGDCFIRTNRTNFSTQRNDRS